MPINHSSIVVTPGTTGTQVDTATLPSGRVREVGAWGSPTIDDNIPEPTTADLVPAGTLAFPFREALAGHSTFHRIGTSGTNAVVVKATPGRTKYVHAFNGTTGAMYVKFYNSTGPVAGTTTVINTFGVQSGTAAHFPYVRDYSTAIAITLLKDAYDSGTNGLDAGNQCTLDLEYL